MILLLHYKGEWVNETIIVIASQCYIVQDFHCVHATKHILLKSMNWFESYIVLLKVELASAVIQAQR